MPEPKTAREHEIKNFINEYTKILINYAKTEFGLPDTWKVNIDISYASGVIISRGGIKRGFPFFKIAAYRFSVLDELTHVEYAHIEKDPVIGAMGKVSWIKYLAALVSHELAHAIFRSTKISIGPFVGKEMFYYGKKKVERAAHGREWQHIYRKFRENFVNDFDFSTISYKSNTNVKKIRNSKFTAHSVTRKGVRHTVYCVGNKKVGCVSVVGRNVHVAFKWENESWEKVGTYESGVIARNIILRGL